MTGAVLAPGKRTMTALLRIMGRSGYATGTWLEADAQD